MRNFIGQLNVKLALWFEVRLHLVYRHRSLLAVAIIARL